MNKQILRLRLWATTLAFGVLALCELRAQIGPPDFGMVGITEGQTIRLNVVAYRPGPCRVELTFTDRMGHYVGPTRQVDLASYQSAFLDLDADVVIPRGSPPGTRAEVRPFLEGHDPHHSCVATAEVFDNLTGKSTLVEQSLGPHNHPRTRQRFGMVGIVQGQTVRLDLVAFPPGPCRIELGFADSRGNPVGRSMSVDLASWQSTFLDLPAEAVIPSGSPPATRAEVRATLEPGQPHNLCGATLEVFDNATGKTTVTLPYTGPPAVPQ